MVDLIFRAFAVFNIAKYPFTSYHSQNYFGIVIYLLLAAAICGLLATLAYLFSLSSAQDSEKRSEYECGFEPFDSATRLPFDVHFYLVGILFLIFDVEIALLFPWVLGLHTAGWFSFYIVLGFIVLLGVGFLYEWKRGALIWPSRQSEINYVPQSVNSAHLTTFKKQNSLSYLTYFAKCDKTFSSDADVDLVINKNLNLITVFAKALRKLNLTARIARTKRALLRRRPVTLRSYIMTIAEAETKLDRYKRIVYFFIKKSLALSAACRVLSSTDELKIAKKEQALLNVVSPIAYEYGILVTTYKKFYKRLKSSALVKQSSRLSPVARKKLSALRRYLLLQVRYFGRKNSRAKKEKRLLRKQLNSGKKTNFSHAISPNRKAVAVLPFFFDVDTIFINQAVLELLPEILLSFTLLITLVFLALGLGEGKSKKVLAAESFFCLSRVLLVVSFLYFLELLGAVNTNVIMEGYASISIYSTVIKLLTVLTGRFILMESRKFMTEHSRHLLEYPLILTTAIFFMLLLVGSNHLVSAFLSLVGFSLNLYVLVLFDAPLAAAREAGIKYFYLSTISSGLILYGTFLLIAILGTGNFYEMQQILTVTLPVTTATADLLQLAIAFILIGFFFKLSSFPGHLWAADVYEGSPDPITAFFMLPVKVAVLGFVVQLLAVALEPASAFWQPIIAFGAASSLIWGCFAALAEGKTKRFLAYASINQIGFLLLGLATASHEGYRATIFYLLLYAAMNTAFLLVFLNARRPDGRSLIYLVDFRGFGMRYGMYSWSIAVALFSMAGIPPLAGFFGKYYLLLHAQEHGLYFLVIIGLATSLVSTYYYLRLIKIFWFEGEDALVPVSCDLSTRQSGLLTFLECTLWVISVYAIYINLYLDYAISSLFF